MNRRDFVLGVGGAAFVTRLATHGPELRAIAAYAASVAPEEHYQFFSVEQAREFDAISAQIVPTDDTPGAREAHVVRFVDRYLATVAKDEQPGLQGDFTVFGDAMAAKTPGSRSFAALSDANQIAFLTELEKSHPDVFEDFRDYTMLGMFSHPMHGGNFNKVGWKLIGFEDRPAWVPPFGYYDRV